MRDIKCLLWLCALLAISPLHAQTTEPPPGPQNPIAEAAEQPARPESGVVEPTQPGLAPTQNTTAAQRTRIARESARGGTPAEKATSLLGLLVFVGVAWLLSVNRSAVRWRVVVWGLGLQFVFAVLILLTAPGRAIF
jgi:hypothetical protein